MQKVHIAVFVASHNARKDISGWHAQKINGGLIDRRKFLSVYACLQAQLRLLLRLDPFDRIEQWHIDAMEQAFIDGADSWEYYDRYKPQHEPDIDARLGQDVDR